MRARSPAATALAALLAAAAPRAAIADTACSDLFTVDLRKPSAGATAFSDLFTIDLRPGRADATPLEGSATSGLAGPGGDRETRRGARADAPSKRPGSVEGLSPSRAPPASSSACRR